MLLEFLLEYYVVGWLFTGLVIVHVLEVIERLCFWLLGYSNEDLEREFDLGVTKTRGRYILNLSLSALLWPHCILLTCYWIIKVGLHADTKLKRWLDTSI